MEINSRREEKTDVKTNMFKIADDRGIRYTWLAGKLSYTPEYLSRIKHGAVPITEEFQRRVCELFPEIPMTELFFEGDVSIHNHLVRVGETQRVA